MAIEAAELAEDLERVICALADIGNAVDLSCKDARAKARRVYRELRRKYPIDVRDALPQGPNDAG